MAGYELSALAEADLDGIAAYSTLEYGPEKAREYKASIIQSAQTAANFPMIGTDYVTADGMMWKRYSVGRHILFYQSLDDGILIGRVLHQAMDFERYL